MQYTIGTVHFHGDYVQALWIILISTTYVFRQIYFIKISYTGLLLQFKNFFGEKNV